jgi:hypothetical protein
MMYVCLAVDCTTYDVLLPQFDEKRNVWYIIGCR